jgi:hypothetical protein
MQFISWELSETNRLTNSESGLEVIRETPKQIALLKTHSGNQNTGFQRGKNVRKMD